MCFYELKKYYLLYLLLNIVNMIKKYFKRKSKLAIAIDILIFVMLIFIAIPSTRKNTLAFILKPTMYFHQPKVIKNKTKLESETYLWKLQNQDGIVFSLNDFKDKVVFINLWATWCPPCIAEMPDLQKLYGDYGDKVEFLFVSNEQTDEVHKFMVKNNYTLPYYKPVTQYPDQLLAKSIPTTYVINKKGEITIYKAGLAKWNSQRIRKVLDVLINQ